MSKLDQLRAMRERQFSEPKPAEPAKAPAAPPKFDKTAYQREYMRLWREEHKNEAPTALYRHFNAGGELLYIGIAAHVTIRNRQHQKRAAWWADVAHTAIEYFPTRIEALAAESAAVAAENPLHNTQLKAQLIAPPGLCPECDARREYSAATMRRWRAKQP